MDENGFRTVNVMMPNLDTFCRTKFGSPDLSVAHSQPNASRFEMATIDAWDRLVLLGMAERVHSIQVKVSDLDRKDAWDTVKDAIGPLIETVIGKVSGLVQRLAASVSSAIGDASGDMKSTR
jgi:hypothetical protein